MRTGRIERNTEETRIAVAVDLDGTGRYSVSTGIGFLDHMIEQFARHSLIDLECRVEGDLHVDQHHTTEDSAIAIGQAIAQALGEKRGITRYGHAYSPMDETLARVALDISGRPFLVWKAGFSQPRLGEMDTELFEHWFHSIGQAAGITLHVELLYGQNNHHIVEAIFKGFARAMRAAVTLDPRKGDAIPSTKGVLGGEMAETVALIDYGAGNLHSVENALRTAGAGHVAVTADPQVVRAADRVVLPGVGAFRACAEALRALPHMVEAMAERVFVGGAPFLGVCVGMQLLATRGLEHGETPGLGWIAGEVRPIDRTDPAIKVPHMGWNDVAPTAHHDGAMLIEAGEAYFLHSYHFAADEGRDVAALTDHGGGLVAAVARDNLLGVQFHPEKSQAYGLALLERFLAWRP